MILEDAAGVQSVIRLGDRVRDDARRFVCAMREQGLDVALLSGDHVNVAQAVGRAVGIETVRGQVDPLSKARWIREKRAGGHRVLFAGDGINDGPALAEADVGIAMRGSATSSVLIADAIVSSDALAPIAVGMRAARACRRAVRSNTIRAVTYNVLAVGAAVAGFINPLVAAVLMPLSSAMVIWGASRVEATVAGGD